MSPLQVVLFDLQLAAVDRVQIAAGTAADHPLGRPGTCIPPACMPLGFGKNGQHRQHQTE